MRVLILLNIILCILNVGLSIQDGTEWLGWMAATCGWLVAGVRE